MSKSTYFISGSRLYLREVRISDVNERYYNWLNDPSINQFLETRYFPRSQDNIKSFVEKLDGNSNEIFLAICYKATNDHIGNIKLGPINWIHKFADISLLIGEKQYWGKGLATEAICLVTEYAFNVLNLHKLKAGCYEDNLGSSKAFQKVGFQKEGCLKNQWLINGKYQNQILLGLCSEDYNSL